MRKDDNENVFFETMNTQNVSWLCDVQDIDRRDRLIADYQTKLLTFGE